MSADMSPGSLGLESQLLSIMDVLVRAAVTEISQLFSESSASLCLQLTQSQKENEAMRMRMKGMRSELFSLRLQTRANRPASRFSPGRGSIAKPRTKTPGEVHFFLKTTSSITTPAPSHWCRCDSYSKRFTTSTVYPRTAYYIPNKYKLPTG